MLYAITLFLHAWLRWIILGLCSVQLIRSLQGMQQDRALGPLDKRLGLGLLISVDVQLLLGLLLFGWLSPVTDAAFADMRAAMKYAPLRFFVAEHTFGMVLFVIGIHLTRILAKKKPTARAAHRTTAIGLGIALLIALLSIPWPSRPYGRPLLRLPVAEHPPVTWVPAPQRTGSAYT